jgi:hypothetical protein
VSAFTTCVAAVVLLLQDAPATDALTELAARCGSELEWAQDWDDAATRARREDRLVLVYVRDQRGFAISDAAMIGPFMDEDVVAWVRERCVPLKFDRHADDAPFEDPAVFGLGPLTFGLAVLLTTPSGEVVAQTCLPTTEGVAALLDQTFAKQAAPSGARDGSNAAALERARAAFERCELDRALAESQRIDDAEAHVLRARIHRARMQGTDALRELDAAREAGAESARIAVLRAEILLRGGDAVAARDAAQSALEGPPRRRRSPRMRTTSPAPLRTSRAIPPRERVIGRSSCATSRRSAGRGWRPASRRARSRGSAVCRSSRGRGKTCDARCVASTTSRSRRARHGRRWTTRLRT